MLSVEEVRRLFTWDDDAGRLRWRGGNRRGRIAGCVQKARCDERRVAVHIGGRLYKHHRLVWLYFTGEWPPEGKVVDHIDGNTLNDRFENLQVVSRSDNSRRLRRSRGGSSKYRGVSFDKFSNKWFSNVCLDYKQISLGRYKDERAAAAAYEFASRAITDGEWNTAPYADELPPPPDKLFKSKGWKRILSHVCAGGVA